MNDLNDLLTRVADRADEQALPDAARVRARGAQRTRRTAIGVASAALATLVGVVLVTRPGDAARPSPAPIAPSPGQSQTFAPVPGVDFPEGHDPGHWATPALPVQGLPRLRATAVHDGRFVVAGSGSRRDPAVSVWWSDDGLSWHRAGGITTGVADVTATPTGFLALTTGLDHTAAWTSPDGRTWARVARLPHRLVGVSWTRAGGFAWGDGTVQTSPDGVTWTAAPTPAGLAADVLSPCWIDDLGPDVVAYGLDRSFQDSSSRPMTWRWTGTGWASVPLASLLRRFGNEDHQVTAQMADGCFIHVLDRHSHARAGGVRVFVDPGDPYGSRFSHHVYVRTDP